MRRTSLIRLWVLLGALPVPAAAQVDVPAALAPWREWVLHGEEFRACPVLHARLPGDRASHVCAWPGTLSFDIDAAGGRFDQAWTLYADDWVPLPGDASRWPASVTVDGRAEPVVARGGRPMLRLVRGPHRIAGQLTWSARPASLPIPRETGLVSLRVDGQAIASPAIEDDALWLGLRPEAAVEEDRLDVVVHRRLADTLPMRLETVLALDVAGQSREVVLEGAAVEGFVGIALESDLPAQLAPDGTLRAQIRPGSFRIRLTARAPTPPTAVARAAAVDPWPADEIWSFAPEPRLRVAALEGGESIDAARSGVPVEWRDLPSYRVPAGQTLDIVERSRADAAQANRLILRRDLWLDFDGAGFTARDRVQGRMSSRWRLDMARPYTMTMAEIGAENLLVTAGLDPGTQGVELRAADLALTTTARLERASRLPITGYRESFDDVTTTLNVPPGYRVIAAPGADRAFGVWLERWRLLDIFLVLIVGVAAWRLFGPVPGIIALAALVLTFHEPYAPRWAWLNLLVALALLRVAPAGRLRRIGLWYRGLSVVSVALWLGFFAVLAVRAAIFPQLELPVLGRGASQDEALFAMAAAPQPPTATNELLQRAERSSLDALEEVAVTGARIQGTLARYLPGALVQTGPGLPDWSWTRYTLGFSGPVEAGQEFGLVVLGPWLVALWRTAGVALALALLWTLSGRPTRLPPSLTGKAAAAGGIVLIALGALGAPPAARAQAASEFPSPALLDELKRRLTEPAPCHPGCAELTAARVELAGELLTLTLDLALQADVAAPIPSVARGFRPSTIRVNGAPTSLVARDASQTAWLPLAAGVSRVELTGPVPAGGSFALPFPLPPRRIEFVAPGWDVTGVADGRLPSGTLEFVRQRAAGDGATETIAATAFPPFVTVVRRFAFDVDWQVTTTVTRVAPRAGAFTLPIDLVAGEAVLTPGIEVAGGRATAAFVAGQDAVVWESRLPTAATLSLTAPAAAAWTESWEFAVGHIWHADFAGLPATAPLFADPAFYVPEYYPRPAETLTVALSRPDPASGDTIAIDAVDYSRSVGIRASESRLALGFRSTRGGEHPITLPAGSALENVAIDGVAIPLELDGSRLGLPITPGEHHVEIVWRNLDAGVSWRTAVPAVDLGGGASNITAVLDLPADRWVLLTFGPTLGPAVLYWPELVVFVVVAFALGRLASSPLRTHEWLLLGLGLSTFAWSVLVLFALWAFAMSWRGRGNVRLEGEWYNGMQVGLGVLTVAALTGLVRGIWVGLLGQPDMQIVSPVPGGVLSWFVDRSAGTTAVAGAISVSPWFYKGVMLAWALWLSFALLRWLPWAWRAYTTGGIWRGRLRAT